MRSGVFLDWLHIFQSHGDGGLPVVSSEVQLKTDVAMEELKSSSYRFLAHKGSHDTNLMIRCDGRFVEVSGNVGRFGRGDNVFNLDWEDTIAKTNAILARFGLPPFEAGQKYIRDVKTERDARLGLFDAWTGARLSEFHVTENYSAGSDQLAHEVIRYMGSLRAARISKSRIGSTTVVFGSRKSRKQIEVYHKADEMLAHCANDLERQRMKSTALWQWVRDVGMVRIECKFRRGYLRDKRANYLGGVTMGQVINLFDKETGFLHDATPDQCARVVDQVPRKLKGYALNWLRGDDLRNLLSRAQFYRVTKLLREFGIDASEPRGVSDNAERDLQKILDGLPQFELRALSMPEWYDAAEEYREAA
jgi:hypothetical protein